MTVPYHYIVAGLPDLFLDEGKPSLTLSSFIGEMKEQVPPEDVVYLGYLGYPIDNRNVIDLLLNEKGPIARCGNFAEEELQSELKNPDALPDYMQDFLAAFRENAAVVQNLSWENQLNWLFFENVTQVDNDFLREWFTFELNLGNVLAAINCRKTARPAEHHIVGRNEITDLLLKSSAPDFSLSSKLSWTDEVFSIDFNKIAESEKKLADFKLQVLDDIAGTELFSIDTILWFGIRLSIIERWGQLDEDAGRKRLDKIIEDLEASYQAE